MSDSENAKSKLIKASQTSLRSVSHDNASCALFCGQSASRSDYRESAKRVNSQKEPSALKVHGNVTSVKEAKKVKRNFLPSPFRLGYLRVTQGRVRLSLCRWRIRTKTEHFSAYACLQKIRLQSLWKPRQPSSYGFWCDIQQSDNGVTVTLTHWLRWQANRQRFRLIVNCSGSTAVAEPKF